MRYPALLLATLLFAACSTGPVTHNQPQAVSPTRGVVPESQKASVDSVVHFLLASAAADFHTHGPSHILQFRDVRIGHVSNPNGGKLYVLCGQFLPARDGGKAEWIPFATIKTSGYEQYIGAQVATFCKDSSIVWDKEDDLSSLLQSQLDSLR